MPVGQMPVGQMPVGQMPVGQMPVGQMPVGQTVFDQKTWHCQSKMKSAYENICYIYFPSVRVFFMKG
jgi:hypothetical protein